MTTETRAGRTSSDGPLRRWLSSILNFVSLLENGETVLAWGRGSVFWAPLRWCATGCR